MGSSARLRFLYWIITGLFRNYEKMDQTVVSRNFIRYNFYEINPCAEKIRNFGGRKMYIHRDRYLQKIIDRQWNGAIKVITGLRRCGKSFLLFEIYKKYLLEKGVKPENILCLALDDDENERYRDTHELSAYLRSFIKDENEQYYILLDEVQYAISAEEWKNKEDVRLYSVLNGLLRKRNVDIYVTGSNSRFLSSDVLTEFRGRGDEIKVNPLTFSEFMSAYSGTEEQGWSEYMRYGGMPRILEMKTDSQKVSYLERLYAEVYMKDIADRYGFYDLQTMEDLVNILSSAAGSLTNPSRLADTFQSVEGKNVSDKTVRTYIEALKDSFLISEAQRFDVRGNAYIGSPYKYYFSDLGLRNAKLNFRQQDPGHIMENIIYNELRTRELNVDVGVVHFSEKGKKVAVEVDFVCNQGSQRFYIQSAYTMPDEEKRVQEERPLIHIPDSFKKMILVNDNVKPWHDEKGVTIMSVRQFLMDENSIYL